MESRATAATACAASIAPTIGRGTCSTTMASVFGSVSAVATTAASFAGCASPRTSTGFARGISGGSSVSSAATVSGAKRASATPASSAQSAASTAGPRPFDTIARRSPRGILPIARMRAAANNCV